MDAKETFQPHTRPGCEETIHFKTSRLQPLNDTCAQANGIWQWNFKLMQNKCKNEANKNVYQCMLISDRVFSSKMILCGYKKINFETKNKIWVEMLLNYKIS